MRGHDGNQQCDGTVERQVSVHLNDDANLAALLVQAAAELDRLQ